MDLKKPTLQYLSDLVYSHQINIPFEDIDTFESTIPSLDLESVFDKIVVRERGGYCFEMNELFCALLNSLGYDAWGCICKVSMGSEGQHMISHRATIVRIEGTCYFCDVGFGGPMPRGALKIVDGLSQDIENDTFIPRDLKNGWWELRHIRQNGDEVCELMFQTAVADDLDFIPLNAFLSDHNNLTSTRIIG